MRPRLPLLLYGLLVSVSGGLGALSCDPAPGVAPPMTNSTASCPAAACAGVHFAADFAASSADAANLELQLCHKDLCSKRRPGAAGPPFDCAFFGPLTASCTLSVNGGGLHLEGAFQGVMTGWADGDVFSVRVALPPAAPLVELGHAVRLTVSHPAGNDCLPLCLSGSLD